MSDNISNNINCIENHHIEIGNIKIFGLWIYLLSDCILFATLFAVHIILKDNMIADQIKQEIFNLPFVLCETFLLLFSTMSYSMAVLNDEHKKHYKYITNMWLCCTLLLGIGFIFMEWYEFQNLIIKGYGPSYNAYFSSFFTLLGMHSAHIIVGLIWIMIVIIQIFIDGGSIINKIRLQCLGLFWHFLDIIWIVLFTVVYLIGIS